MGNNSARTARMSVGKNFYQATAWKEVLPTREKFAGQSPRHYFRLARPTVALMATTYNRRFRVIQHLHATQSQHLLSTPITYHLSPIYHLYFHHPPG